MVQFFKFGIVGLSNTALSFAVYSLLVYLGVPYLGANAAAFVLGVLNSFFWNRKFVFKDETGGARGMAHTLIKTYASYSFSGLIVGSVLLYVLIGRWGISKYSAQLCVLFVTVPLNYILNRQWTFKNKPLTPINPTVPVCRKPCPPQ